PRRGRGAGRARTRALDAAAHQRGMVLGTGARRPEAPPPLPRRLFRAARERAGIRPTGRDRYVESAARARLPRLAQRPALARLRRRRAAEDLVDAVHDPAHALGGVRNVLKIDGVFLDLLAAEVLEQARDQAQPALGEPLARVALLPAAGLAL